MANRDIDKAALCGEPSYVWRSGQERRFQMILKAAGNCIQGKILENGCGIGVYLERLALLSQTAIGLEYDHHRAQEAHQRAEHVICAVGEVLPLPDDHFDVILSHEVLEHVQDDRAYVEEMVRSLSPGGRIILFVPNRGYPFETHGIYWRGQYRFGNIPLVNYLPRRLRDKLVPHVRVYTRQDLNALFSDLPVRFVQRTVIFGAYDNIIARWPVLGWILRGILQGLERTPAKVFGLSHFWVIEKV
jgi:SAM-dependent methyltransferase